MRRKRFSIFLTTFCICLSLIIILCAKTYSSRFKSINALILEHTSKINLLEPIEEEPFVAESNTKVINSKAKIESTTTDYTAEIIELYPDKMQLETLDKLTYYSYSFNADVKFSKIDGSEQIETIFSKIILEKVDNNFIVKSIDDLKLDINKAIINLKKDKEEDISAEFNKISLLYRNENLDININYPDYYTYTKNETKDSKQKIEDTVTFYMNEDKTSNYIQIRLDENPHYTYNQLLKEYTDKQYELLDYKLQTANGLTFDIITQAFTNNNNPFIEYIYISNEPYKTVQQTLITVRISESIQKEKQSEIDEIIKSIK